MSIREKELLISIDVDCVLGEERRYPAGERVGLPERGSGGAGHGLGLTQPILHRLQVRAGAGKPYQVLLGATGGKRVTCN